MQEEGRGGVWEVWEGYGNGRGGGRGDGGDRIP